MKLHMQSHMHMQSMMPMQRRRLGVKMDLLVHSKLHMQLQVHMQELRNDWKIDENED